MLTAYCRREYTRLRAKGWPASEALRAARVRDVFTDLEAADLVRLRFESETEPYDMSFIDTWSDMRLCDRERTKADLIERIDRHGLYYVVAEARATEDDRWEECDSIGGIVGDDFEDSGYDTDLRQSAIDCYHNLIARSTSRL